MNNLSIGRPNATEYPPYAQEYLNLVVGSNVLDLLTTQLEEVQTLLKPVGDRRASEFAYAPGKWTVKQVLGHLIDSERIFSYRALCVARNEANPLPGFEQDDYVAAGAFNERPLNNLLDEFRAARLSTIALFQNLPEQAWLRQGTANKCRVTVRGVAFHAAGHCAHHLKILREKYF
jgi:uncharacterized damage-inducible protein DinB